MSELKTTGKIVKFLEVQSGESKTTGKEWKKQSFVIDTGSEYDNIQCFEVFGEEKVTNLTNFNNLGDNVTVSFNIKSNEYNGKYYTSLSAWHVDKVSAEAPVAQEAESDLPF